VARRWRVREHIHTGRWRKQGERTTGDDVVDSDNGGDEIYLKI
jgi:hypothetical protein